MPAKPGRRFGKYRAWRLLRQIAAAEVRLFGHQRHMTIYRVNNRRRAGGWDQSGKFRLTLRDTIAALVREARRKLRQTEDR